jgi:hypothetical protein
MADPSVMQQWTVVYGDNNDAAGNGLYTRLNEPIGTRVDLGVGGAARDALKEVRQRQP